MVKVGDLRTFTNFVRLCAGRTAAEVNLLCIGADAGVSHNTAKAWLSILEASYLVFRLSAWHLNFRKQVIKAPKLHFVDTGLACYLLGIRAPDQLRTHPLRGALFETWVASEVMKQVAYRGERAQLFHYRDAGGLEVDLVSETAGGWLLTQAKSGATVAGDFTKAVDQLAASARAGGAHPSVAPRVIYGGVVRHSRQGTDIVSWSEIDTLAW